MLFLSYNSFFLQRNRVENFKPRVLSPILKLQSSSVFIWTLEENEDFICYEVSGTILSSVSAFCFMQFHVGRFETSPDHVRLVSATVLVNLVFTHGPTHKF